MRYKIRVWLGVLSAAVFILAACGGGGSATEDGSAATPSGDGNQSASSTDLALDPANASGENALAVVGYLYEGLSRIQDDIVTVALAENVTVSEDGLDYIFTLRSGVAFHDGSTLNADAVVANFNRWFDPNDPNRGSGEFAAWVENFGGFKGELKEDGKPKSHFDGVEKVDDLTVLVHLNTPDPDLLKKLSDPAFSIISSNAFGGGDGGTGPYKFVSSDGTTLTLEPFAGYWDPAAIPSEGMQIPAP